MASKKVKLIRELHKFIKSHGEGFPIDVSPYTTGSNILVSMGFPLDEMTHKQHVFLHSDVISSTTIIPKKKKEKFSATPIKFKPNGVDVTTNDFLKTYEWRKLRMEAIVKYGNACQCCGNSPKNGAVINVDHVKPRKKYPELALDITNLQVLCSECNHGKGNWNMTDWR